MSALRALSGRTQVTGEIVMTRCVVRRRVMDGTPLEALEAFLRADNFTGSVVLGVSRGSIRTIAVEDRQDIEG